VFPNNASTWRAIFERFAYPASVCASPSNSSRLKCVPLESIMIGDVAQEVLRNAERTVLLVGGQRSPDDPMLSEPVRPDLRSEDQPT
jgi:hypothetical protein